MHQGCELRYSSGMEAKFRFIKNDRGWGIGLQKQRRKSDETQSPV